MNIVIYLLRDQDPAGLSSAYAAAKNGAKVILAEDKPRFGGSLLTDDVTIDNLSGKAWTDKIITELKEMPNVIVKNRSQVFGYYDHNMMVMFERTGDHLKINLNTLQDRDYGISELKKYYCQQVQ